MSFQAGQATGSLPRAWVLPLLQILVVNPIEQSGSGADETTCQAGFRNGQAEALRFRLSHKNAVVPDAPSHSSYRRAARDAGTSSGFFNPCSA